MATVTACPLDVLPANTGDMLRLWRFANKGLLPRGGGLMDQTQAFIDMLEHCDRYDAIARADCKVSPDYEDDE